MDHKYPYDKYMIVGGIVLLVAVILAMSLCSCSFLIKELPLEEKIAEDIIHDVEGNTK